MSERSFRAARGTDVDLDLGWDGWRVMRGSRSSTEIVVSVVVGLALLSTLAVVWLPALEGRLVSRFVALGVVLLGLQFSVGVANQLSLCHGVFVGVGAYTATIASARYGVPLLLATAVAPVLGFVTGTGVGALALRIRATYLGPVTMSVAVAFPMIVKRFDWFTGGSSGLPVVHTTRPPAFLGLAANRAYVWNHLIIVAIAVVAVVAARNLVLSPVGLSVRAMAENPLSAAASGVNVRRTRLVAYGWGAAFGALGGALLVVDTPIVGADSFDLFRSLGYYAAVMVGGVTSMAGAGIGAALLVGVAWLLDTQSWHVSENFVLGGLLVVATLIAPSGFAASLRRGAERFVRIEEAAAPVTRRTPTRPPPVRR